MKIHQLPDGARFEYEGEEYVKTAPMCGTGKNGQRMIPRYAVLKPIGGAEVAQPPTKGDTLPRARVLKAIEAFHAECKALVPAERQAEFDAAREKFLKAIG